MDHFKYSILVLLFLLNGGGWKGWAQDNNLARAERIYTHLVEARGDSIYAALNAEAQRQLSPTVFNDTWKQMEKQFGPFKSAGEWELEQAQGMTLYCRNLTFERYTLRLLLVFDTDGRMNTIRMVPAPVQATTPAVTFDETLKNVFMIWFFTSVGYGASFKVLRRGAGPVLVLPPARYADLASGEGRP